MRRGCRRSSCRAGWGDKQAIFTRPVRTAHRAPGPLAFVIRKSTSPHVPPQFASAMHALARHMPKADDQLEIMSVRAVDVQLLKENIR